MTYFLLALMAVLMSVGQVLFKFGAEKITGRIFHNFYEFTYALVSNGYVWATLIIYAAAFMLWFFILSRAELSIAFPIITATVLAVTIFASYYFFGESITFIKLSAIGLLMLGVLLLAWN